MGSHSLLVIEFLGGQVVARKPYLMQTLRLALAMQQPIFNKVSICIYNLTDDEVFNLWDMSNHILVTFTEQQ